MLHTASVAIRSKVIDIMMLHKNGTPKDANATWRFMKRAASIREELLATASDNATEHGAGGQGKRACKQGKGRAVHCLNPVIFASSLCLQGKRCPDKPYRRILAN